MRAITAQRLANIRLTLAALHSNLMAAKKKKVIYVTQQLDVWYKMFIIEILTMLM